MSTLYVVLEESPDGDSTQVYGKALAAMNYVYLGRWVIKPGMPEEELSVKISDTINYMCAVDERIACGLDRHTFDLIKPLINKDIDVKLLLL